MPFFDPIRIGASAAADSAYTVDRSLRFNDNDSAYLNRTPSSDSNRTTLTLSVWVKRSNLGEMLILDARRDDSNRTRLMFDASNRMQFFTRFSGSDHALIANAVRRDSSEWYHLVWSIDTTQATASNRVKMYVNNELQTLTGSNYPDQNEALFINKDEVHTIGVGQDSGGNEQFFDGYMAEVNFIDGQALTPSSFGETDATTGQWNPIDTSGLTFGTNGFYLNFSDNSGTTATTLGKDSSGNGNNFTPNNLATNDAVKDSPTNNFCTFNPLSNYDNNTLSEGNLKVTGTASDHSWQQVRGNIGVSSGKWYFEIRCNSISATEGWIAGIHEVFGRDTDGYYWYNGSYSASGFGYAYGAQDNDKAVTNTSQKDFTTGITAGKVLGIRMNLDDNEILISVDGVDKGKMYDIQSGITYTPAVNIYTTSSATLNCGQDSTFHGQESAGGNTDSGGLGDFAYAVPSGYKALCSANLPDPTVLQGNKHFDTLLYTGTGSSQNITGLEFQPDWVWVKKRSGSENHNTADAVRGAGLSLRPNTTGAETSSSGAINTFLSNGFTVVDAGETNESGHTYVGWCWNAGGSTVTNNEGSKSAQVRANPTAGISCISYTGDGTSGASVGHGLGVAPKIMFHKDRDSSNNWYTITTAVDGSPDYLYLNLTNSKADSGVTAPTSSLVYFTASSESNNNGNDYIMYAFSEVAGFSKIGTYKGNGSSDGTCVFLGFKPAFVMVKEIDGANNWIIMDSKRGAINPDLGWLYSDNSSAEESGSSRYCDFLSNGFKIRTSGSGLNSSNDTYMYLAFAESPFKYSRAR